MTSAETSLTTFLATLPSKTDSFISYIPSNPPLPDATLYTYLPSPDDVSQVYQIPQEKDRCLIRALKSKAKPKVKPKAKSTTRKRPAPASPGPLRKRPYRWSDLQRERKQACLRIALIAACEGRPHADDVLGRLRRGWAENPRKKQLVGPDVRNALCQTLPRWSVAQLKMYISRAELPVPDVNSSSREDLIAAVRSHLAPVEE